MSKEIKDARQVMREAFEQDEAFKFGYVANIACVLMDNIPGMKRGTIAYERRMDIATQILDRIFSK